MPLPRHGGGHVLLWRPWLPGHDLQHEKHFRQRSAPTSRREILRREGDDFCCGVGHCRCDSVRRDSHHTDTGLLLLLLLVVAAGFTCAVAGKQG